MSVPRSSAPRGPGGFTLLELTIVILIMGVVISFALPRFGSLLDVQIKSGIRQLIGTIKFAYHEAAITQNHLRLNFDIEKGEYWITAYSTSGEFVQEGSTVTDRSSLPDGIRFEDVVTAHAGKVSEKEVFTYFYPNGFVEPTVIHLRGEDEDVKFTLRIKPLTGSVAIYDRYVDFVEGEVQ